MTEFKVRALKLHPDKNTGKSECTTAEFSRLQRAKEILCDSEKRFLYDRWLGCGISVGFDEWSSKKGTTHMVHNT